jgi:hypothetical protein
VSPKRLHRPMKHGATTEDNTNNITLANLYILPLTRAFHTSVAGAVQASEATVIRNNLIPVLTSVDESTYQSRVSKIAQYQ